MNRTIAPAINADLGTFEIRRPLRFPAVPFITLLCPHLRIGLSTKLYSRPTDRINRHDYLFNLRRTKSIAASPTPSNKIAAPLSGTGATVIKPADADAVNANKTAIAQIAEFRLLIS
jgi:hypothetical protein